MLQQVSVATKPRASVFSAVAQHRLFITMDQLRDARKTRSSIITTMLFSSLFACVTPASNVTDECTNDKPVIGFVSQVH